MVVKPKLPKKTAAKKGRPSKYTDELVQIICSRIANGESLVSICLDEAMPSRSSVLLWLSESTSFSDRYAHAREAQADFLLDELVQIADDGRNDTYTSDDGRELTNQDVIARSRLRVDARKWVIAKLAPKKYSDKITQEITGLDGKDLIQTKTANEMTDDELAAVIAISRSSSSRVNKKKVRQGQLN